ncbi:MAG TPA: ATP-binding protein, partial [Gemmataceae bacterium]|nr:ATP-binding protein [Gemmataceae bacterium]
LGDLRDTVRHAVDLVQVRARRQQVAIEMDMPQTAVLVEIDQEQVGTVLVNLFLNALDALPHGGTVEVTLEVLPEAGIRLEIADTGPGIAPEIADRLFTPFTSTKPTGTGLGLSLSRRIIEEHGGKMTASNRSEGGACFTITLPVEARREEPAQRLDRRPA